MVSQTPILTWFYVDTFGVSFHSGLIFLGVTKLEDSFQSLARQQQTQSILNESIYSLLQWISDDLKYKSLLFPTYFPHLRLHSHTHLLFFFPTPYTGTSLCAHTNFFYSPLAFIPDHSFFRLTLPYPTHFNILITFLPPLPHFTGYSLQST